MEQGSLQERYLSRSVIKHIRRLNPKLSVSAAVGNDYANLHGSVSADGIGDTPWIAWVKAMNNFACSGGQIEGARLTMLLPQNVNNLVAQNAYVFILATGMLFCILTGGNIDLSVGSVVCFVAAVGGKMMVLNSMNPYLTMLVMLLTGIAIGAWQGFWIAYVRIPPFIVTLAGMLAFRGLSNVVLEGQTLAPMPDAYLGLFNNYIPDFLGGGEGFNRTCFVVGIIVCIVYVALVMKNRADRAKKGYSVEAFGGTAVKMVLICAVVLAFMFRLAQYKGIPNSLLWVAVIIAIYTYIASKTTTGRYFYAVGGNEKATKLSGIDTNKVYFLAYLNMGLLAAIAGMVTMARLNSSNPQAGTNFEMDAIGACFIGGASAYGCP